jgi:acetyl esterase/lipase
MDQLSIDLADAGFAAWNIEYRRGSGAWQEALDDVAGAVDHLGAISVEHDVDLGRVALVGHSAGGHLALWAAGRRRHGPSADALVHPFLAVPLAPVTNLVECAHRGLGEGAALAFFEAVPQDEPERYRSADPMQRLPLGVPTTVVQGLADGPDLIDLNRRFTAFAAALGESVDLVELPGANHFDVIDPSTAAWGAVRDLLVERLRTPREA